MPSGSLEEDRSPRLRIIGGKFRGRLLAYSGDVRTRPMKDRVREAVFNLVGPQVVGMLAIDLFAGTGALGLEALSRGAALAILLERHFPTAALIGQNATTLQVAGAVEVLPADTFIWARKQLPAADRPWLVFCSPPYDFYTERHDDMLALIDRLMNHAPAGSILVVEADERFNFRELPHPDDWDVRSYPPALVGLYRKRDPSAQM